MRQNRRAHGLQPHKTRLFKLSTDPRFAEKLVDIVGLYINPPEHAVVLSIDEKSQIQALDRIQPGLPMKKGRCGSMTHDYKRNYSTLIDSRIGRFRPALAAQIPQALPARMFDNDYRCRPVGDSLQYISHVAHDHRAKTCNGYDQAGP